MKNRKKYLSYLLAFSIGLNSSQSTYFKPTLKTEKSSISSFNFEEESLKAHLRKIRLEYLRQKIIKFEIHYNYENFYPKETMIDLIIEEQNQTVCKNKNNDLTELKKTIIENSLQDEKSLFISLESRKKFNKEELERDKVARIALSIALENSFKCPSDQLEDICRMKTLKILIQTFDNKNVLAKYDEKKNSISIDYDKIKKKFQNFYMNQNEKECILYLASNIEHELNHCREFKCSCRETENLSTNIASYPVLKFLIEASAESGTYNFNPEIMQKTNSKDYSYYEHRKEEANLLFLVLFKENKTLDEYYNAVFNSDIHSLLDYFDIQTKEDAKTFFYIAYSVDAHLKENDLYFYLAEQFGNIYTEQEIKEKIGYTYKLDIYKIALKNLINEMSKKNINLNETLYLHNFLKSYLLSDIYRYEPNFQTSFSQLDSYFNTYMKEYFNTTYENIKELEKNNLNFFINNNQNETQIKKENDFQKLVEKYPLLQTIAWTHSLSLINMPLFDDQLTLKKELDS